MVGRFESTSQNRETQIPRSLALQIRIEMLIEFASEFLCISPCKFKLRFTLNLIMQLTKISPPFRISICIPLTITSLTGIFSGTDCVRDMLGPDWVGLEVQTNRGGSVGASWCRVGRRGSGMWKESGHGCACWMVAQTYYMVGLRVRKGKTSVIFDILTLFSWITTEPRGVEWCRVKLAPWL